MSWKLDDLTAAAGAPPAATGSALDGYQTTSPNQQHVNYIGTDGHIHELWYANTWTHNDLTKATGAPLAAPGSPLDGYASPNQQHVNYIGIDGHIHELWYGTQWAHNDLTEAAGGAPPAAPGSGLDGYVTASPNQQHVNYIGTDGHVHELWYGTQWAHNDLTAAAGGAPPAVLDSTLDGYVTASPNQQHVNYIGTDGHVHELWYGTQWSHNDLTVAAGAPLAALDSTLDGYVTTSPNQQHVNYIGTDNHVHELWYETEWSHNDLTAAAGAPDAASGSPLDGYTSPKQQHVNFIGVDRHVHELWYETEWSHNDLTAATGAGVVDFAGRKSSLDGYETTYSNQQHVNYVGTNNHVFELWYQN